MINDIDRIERGPGRVLGWSWGASLAAGALTGIISRNAGAGALVAGIGASLPLFYGLGCALLDDLAGRKWVGYLRQVYAERDRLTTEHIAKQNELHAIRVLPGDANGRLGVTYDGKTYHNMDTGEAFTQLATLYLDPMRAQLDAIQRMMISMRGVNAGNAKTADQLLDNVVPGVAWPSIINADAIEPSVFSMNNVVVGVRPDERGTLLPVADSLADLTHILVVGASRWGKSSWLRWFIWQLAHWREPVQVVAIDPKGTEFNLLNNWRLLMYPVVRQTDDAIAVLRALSKEIERRQRLFEQYPLVTKLSEYNQAGADPLPQIVVMIDEGTTLLGERGIGDAVQGVVSAAAQYGVSAVVSGQNANYKVLDKRTQDNFSCRLALHTSPTSSQAVLDTRAAFDLRVKGRALAQIPEEPETVEIQTPYITREQLYHVLTTGQPSMTIPITESMEHPQQPTLGKNRLTVEQVREMVDDGLSATEIARRAWGYDNARVIELASSFIASLSDDNDSDDNVSLESPIFDRVNGGGLSSLQGE